MLPSSNSLRNQIGADGARSLIRQTMGVQYTAWEYEQKGIVATLEVAAVTLLYSFRTNGWNSLGFRKFDRVATIHSTGPSCTAAANSRPKLASVDYVGLGGAETAGTRSGPIRG